MTQVIRDRMKSLLNDFAAQNRFKVHALQVTSVNVILIMDGEAPAQRMGELLAHFCNRVTTFQTMREAKATEMRNGRRRPVKAWHVSGWLK
jgi:hypothetical protein